MQDQNGQLLTRNENILVPLESGNFNRSDRTVGLFRSQNRGLLAGAELFDERYAIDFVQGRNPGENLLQGRFSQTR